MTNIVNLFRIIAFKIRMYSESLHDITDCLYAFPRQHVRGNIDLQASLWLSHHREPEIQPFVVHHFTAGSSHVGLDYGGIFRAVNWWLLSALPQLYRLLISLSVGSNASVCLRGGVWDAWKRCIHRAGDKGPLMEGRRELGRLPRGDHNSVVAFRAGPNATLSPVQCRVNLCLWLYSFHLFNFISNFLIPLGVGVPRDP